MKVLIVGRANVGKSTFLNRVIGRKDAITSNVAGTTRDVRSYDVEWNGVGFELLDSGGILLHKGGDVLQSEINARVMDVISGVDVVLFLLDGRTGLQKEDLEIAELLRRGDARVVVGVNKVDEVGQNEFVYPFYKLGFKEVVGVSAMQGRGIGDLLDLLVLNQEGMDSRLQGSDELESGVSDGSVAIVGRPNLGKSSLLNVIAGKTRAIVSDVAGTTRDTVRFTRDVDGMQIEFVDTAGKRRKNKVDDGVEYYSNLRADRALAAADLVVVLLDSVDYLTDQDKRLLALVLENKRNMIVFVNKWDLVERTDQMRKDLEQILHVEFPTLQYYPVVFGSATEKHGVQKLLDLTVDVLKRAEIRVNTSDMNKFVEKVIHQIPPPAKKGLRLKVFYATQAEISPPTFVFFVNHAKLVSMNYRRFVEGKLRGHFGHLFGVAMRLKFRSRTKV